MNPPIENTNNMEVTIKTLHWMVDQFTELEHPTVEQSQSANFCVGAASVLVEYMTHVLEGMSHDQAIAANGLLPIGKGAGD